MTLPQLIRHHGGPAKFARLTGIPYRTVQSWARQDKADGRTPAEWMASIIEDAIKYRQSRSA